MTEATQSLLESLDDEVFVTCYLTGDYPAQWKRPASHSLPIGRHGRLVGRQLAVSIRGHLRNHDRQTIGQNEEKLVEQGLNYSRIAFTESGAQAFKTIWPAALISGSGQNGAGAVFRSEVPEPTESMI